MFSSCSTPGIDLADYRGRFAPSPTGPLHFGSLIAALASCLEARRVGGQWWVRMEDLDTPRCVPGAADEILRTLELFGFEWDGPVLYQSQRGEAYRAALERLRAAGLAYACGCSRKEIAEAATHAAVDGGLVYPGICRSGLQAGHQPRAWRLRVDDRTVAFVDALQGRVAQHLAHDVGDFVLLRADGLFAYQLAVTVDDDFQQISDVVRGADLLASTPRQIYLQQALGYSTPNYLHLPVATNPAGEKWSKQTLAPALVRGQAAGELVRALRFLGQPVPVELDAAPLAEVWQWALAHWSPAAIPRRAAISSPAAPG